MLTDQDIAKLIEAQRAVFPIKEDVATKADFGGLQTSFSDLQASVDRYLTFTEAWHQELTILKSRQDRLAQVLIDKGLVTEKEITLLT